MTTLETALGGKAAHAESPLRELCRRRVDDPTFAELFRKHHAHHGQGALRNPSFQRRRYRPGSRCRPCRPARVGQNCPPPPEHASSNRSLSAWSRTLICSRPSKPGITASRSAKPWRPTFRWRSITFVISQGRSGHRKVLSPGDRRRHRCISLPRAARRCRANHPLEFPHLDGRLETRAGHSRRATALS